MGIDEGNLQVVDVDVILENCPKTFVILTTVPLLLHTVKLLVLVHIHGLAYRGEKNVKIQAF